ncbi:MAG: NAD-dependent protein deacylase [Alphaproteobacteria bacterium ADurb.Bin438]|nr:MAG: NAD-dependent protein deacylase [Alphaproteobacteria bacterium ADurb.Bin438]
MKNITILTGAGISADSGLATFRDNDGLWNNHKVEDVATYDGFKSNKKLVYDFYNNLRSEAKNYKPNEAHVALSRLESEYKDGKVTIITQNVDDFHRLAGSKNVIHMHGELNKARCEYCLNVFDVDGDFDESTKCEKCGKDHVLRPHIVWFGEMPLYMALIDEVLNNTDLFVAIGTSGVVYPAAGFIARIKQIGKAKAVELNLKKSETNGLFDKYLEGKAKTTVPAFVDKVLEGKDLF